mgnify:CR=1 FL=1
MLQLGKKQELEIVKKVSFGVYLAEEPQGQERVLLPKKEVDEGAQEGDRFVVFLYKDSKDRLIATRREPVMEVGGLAVLKVAEVGKIGAFLDWGLEKDLLLPFKEQTRKVHEGESCLVALYIDKSNRLCATMNVYKFLRTDSPYHKDDRVKGTVYEISENFGVFVAGAFVAVDNLYSALIPKREMYGRMYPGQEIEARVAAVKEDGKLDLSDRDKIPVQMEEDAEAVMKAIEEFEGVLPFNDKVSPEIIQREFGLSKAAFKRAVGKQGRIQITQNRILKVDPEGK